MNGVSERDAIFLNEMGLGQLWQLRTVPASEAAAAPAPGPAPLQRVAIQRLREYGYHELADRIKKAWIKTCIDVYKSQGKMVEKYNVVESNQLGGGGEYALQDGFGWTNGVLAALLAEDEKKEC